MEPGALLGERFELEHQIGSGGMGKIFRAHDRASGETVVVKIISEAPGFHGERFGREIKVLAALSHPGIVRYVSHGALASGELFLVMEWLDGEDLERRLERAPLTAGESVQLVTRVAEALGTAHARGIVHRDLKPSNLFLPGDHIEQVKVLDFGIAWREGGTPLTRTGTMLGSPGYMAPEQASAGNMVDARVDVFALGCVLFRCLTGVPPFDGDSTAAILGKILFSDAPRVSARWSDVPDDLDALVARMLSRDPALRPSDGAHLAAALAALRPLARDAGVTPRERPAPAPARTSGERRFLSVVLLGPTAEDDAAAEAALRRASAPHGGRFERLADGSAIVVLEAEGRVATDLAAQAARCALALRGVAGGRPLAVAMGRADSTSTLPYGDAIDRAARLLAQAAKALEEPPPVALDELMAGLLDARFDVAETEAGLMLRGERALLQGARTLLGRPTSCVGRDWELSALTGLFAECVEEAEARAVVITAAAGMGKSRLTAELIARVRQRTGPVAIWMGRGDSLRAGATLDLLAQALRGALGIRDGTPLAERRAQLRARVAERLPPAEHQRVAELLGELVGAPFPGGGEGSPVLHMARQDAQLMSEQMRQAWIDFLQAETAVQPVLLVLEDLQWGDFGTVRFIDAALRDCANRPWMVLALARPEVHEAFPRLWAERQNVQEIRLKELGKKAGERLVRQVLGDRAGADTVERLVKLADGNAFYLEELIRAVAEGRDKGGALPETVLAMVETRLARLSPDARRVLRAASVFGEVCWEGGVDLLMEGAMEPASVSAQLARLVEQELLVARPHGRFADQRELAFRHALLREAAYATLTDEDRRLGHRRAGEWLEQHGEGDPMVLAGHFARGGAGARAAACYLRASEQAVLILDVHAAMARANLGLGCDPPPELRIALLGMRCEAANYVWHLRGSVAGDAEELLRAAPRGSIPWAQGVLAYASSVVMARRFGELPALVALLQDVDPTPGDIRRMSLAYISTILALDALGQIAEGNALMDRFSEFLGKVGEHERLFAQHGWNLITGIRTADAHEDPWTALRGCDAIQPIFDATRLERIFLSMQLFRGMNLWHLGASALAERMLEEAAAIDQAMGQVRALRRFCLSWIRADRGALDEARALATELCEYGRAQRLPLDECRGRWALAEVLRRQGELEAAERELEAALGLAFPLERPGVLGTLAELRLAQGRAADALAAAEESLALITAMGGCGMFRGAAVRLVRAEALHATGARDAARDAIADARARLLAVADKIGDPAYRESFLEVVPTNRRILALARAWLGEPAPGA
ncbi:MAG TPA: protein kinase [Kofleriaceae bacterium]|nr:protein kinase [Kofleriaceae bacterium]